MNKLHKFNLMSVSYTHLDVYKRQVLYRAEEIRGLRDVDVQKVRTDFLEGKNDK